MKILLFTDLHMCPRASIISKWGTKYSARLENCIATVSWLERLAEEKNCDYIMNLGDFFDRPDLTSDTITACNDIEWSNIMHYSIVGNHDASTSSLLFNSVNSFLSENHKIITEPEMLELDDCYICFLPYIVECDRKPLNEYFKNLDPNKPRVILSHNDIRGIQMGPIVSKTGFSIEEIEATCDRFFNGHLHAGQKLTSKVINVGNVTGVNFSEQALEYSHNVVILDTKDLSFTYVENPHAYNFYKLNIESESDLYCLDKLKNNAVLSIKCEQSLAEVVKEKLDTLDNVVESRIILTRNYVESSDEQIELDLSVDHLARFIECCKTNIENTTLLDEELSEICK
jgi:DNA repair exonuclease SbcCD nuclease subunit